MTVAQKVRGGIDHFFSRLRHSRGRRLSRAEPQTTDSKSKAETVSEPSQIQRPVQRQAAAITNQTLPIVLVNHTTSSNVYVYISGLAANNGNAWFLLQADGATPYFPTSPSATGSALTADIAIRLGGPGSSKTVVIPPIVGGRIFVSIDQPLIFLLNPGPALVEPSVTNQSDPNINVNWAFCEFTYVGLLYANITYVDFVGVPIGLSMTTTSGIVQSVAGMGASGLDAICNNLNAQSTADGVAGWSNLVVTSNGKNLRALSPNSSLGMRPNDFAGYYEPYIDQVWQRYTNDQTLSVRSADASINASGQVSSQTGQLTISGEAFTRPSTADVFSSNTGPFQTGSDDMRNRLSPQLAAAFNRSTLLLSNVTPTVASSFYKSSVTNHYARIVHAENAGGKGYAFPYDDVTPADNVDQSGYVTDPNPQSLTVTFGGS